MPQEPGFECNDNITQQWRAASLRSKLCGTLPTRHITLVISTPLDNEESDYNTTDHQCDLEAFCSKCTILLPWPLFSIRGLDGIALSKADAAIAKLVSSVSRGQTDA
jgi:hypothetical protein